MADENNDDNGTESIESVVTDDSATDTGASPDVETQPQIDDDGFISTVEFEQVEKPAETETGTDLESADTSDDEEQNTSEGQTSKSKGFHDHPDWQKMKAERDEGTQKIADLEAKLSSAERVATPKPADTPTKAQSKLLAMDEDELADRMVSNPREFIVELFEDFAGAIEEKQTIKAQAQTQQEQQTVYENSIKTFFDERPDGQELLKAGKIQKFIADNPGHNAFSAYDELTRETRQQTAIDEAVKAAEKNIYATLKAKGNVNPGATARAGRSANDDLSPEVKNPEKFGGAKAVAVKRYLARQSQ